jgi:hypothetical protein
LVQNKLSSIGQKRDYGTQETNLLNGVLAKRDFSDTRALDLARTKSAEPGATVSSVLQALFELLNGGEIPTAARAARIGSEHILPSKRLSFIENVFQNSSINDDAVQFASAFAQDPNQDSAFAVGLTLAMIPQPGRRLKDHVEEGDLIHTIAYQPRYRDVGRYILRIGERLSYRGPFPISLVAEVIVVAVAAVDGHVAKAIDVPKVMSQLSLPY